MRNGSTKERLLDSSVILLSRDFLTPSYLIARHAGTSRSSIDRHFGSVENLRQVALHQMQQRSGSRSLKQAGIDLLKLLPQEIDGKTLHVHIVQKKLILWCHPGTGRGGKIFGICLNRFANKEVFVAGVSLCAAEGTTYVGEHGRSVEFVNSSASLIRLFLRFLSVLGVSRDRVSCRIELHEGLSVSKAESYWSVESGIPAKNFTKPIIKKISPMGKMSDKNGCLILKFSNKLLRSLLTKWASQLEHIVGRIPQ